MIVRVTAKVKSKSNICHANPDTDKGSCADLHLSTALYASRVLFILPRVCTKALLVKHEVSLSGARAPLWREGRGEVKTLSAESRGAERYTVKRTDRAGVCLIGSGTMKPPAPL